MVEFNHLPVMVEIMLAPDFPSTYDNPSLHLCLCNPPHVYTLQSIAREGTAPGIVDVYTLQSIAREGTACGITDISFDELPVGFMEASSGDADMAHMVYCLQTSSIADKECWFKCFACCQLKSIRNWPDWDNAFDTQLDACCKADYIGVPLP